MLRGKVVLAVVLVLVAGGGLVLWRGLNALGPPVNQSSSQSEPFTVTDLVGRQVIIRPPVRRVVLMRSLFVHELLLVLGDEMETKLVGWDSSLPVNDPDSYQKLTDRYPRLADVVIVGNAQQDTVNPETVIGLQPDLIIMDVFMTDWGVKFARRLEQAGMPMLYLDVNRNPLKGPQASLRLLGRVFGKVEQAERVATHIDSKVDRLLERIKTLDGPMPSVYVESGGTVSNYGGVTGSNQSKSTGLVYGMAQVLDQLRARNIAAAGTGTTMRKINPEHLLKTDPDVIVLTGSRSATPDGLHLGYFADRPTARERLHAFTARPGWAELKAVRTGRLCALSHRLVSHATGFVAAEQLAKWFYPEAFKDLAPQQSHREFSEKFLPVPLSGTWMVDLGAGE